MQFAKFNFLYFNPLEHNLLIVTLSVSVNRAITMRNLVFTHFLCNVVVAINAIGIYGKDYKNQEFVMSSQKYFNKHIDNGITERVMMMMVFSLL